MAHARSTSTRATTATPMGPMRKTALAAGLLYLATFIFSIPAQFGLFDSVLNNTRFVFGAGSDTAVLWGGLFDVLTALTGIGTAVVLYPVVKRYGQNAAMGFVAARTLEAATIFVGVVSLLSIVTLRQDFAGTDTAALSTAAQALVAVKEWTFLLGPGLMPVLSALCLGSLLYRSRLVPRIIPTLGLIGAPLLFIAFLGVLFGQFDQVSAPAALLTLPIGLWELSIGVWMTVKGFTTKPTPDTAAPVVSRAPALSGAPA